MLLALKKLTTSLLNDSCRYFPVISPQRPLLQQMHPNRKISWRNIEKDEKGSLKNEDSKKET